MAVGALSWKFARGIRSTAEAKHSSCSLRAERSLLGVSTIRAPIKNGKTSAKSMSRYIESAENNMGYPETSENIQHLSTRIQRTKVLTLTRRVPPIRKKSLFR